MNNNRPRIGILYPSGNLDSLPCVYNTIALLARYGFLVDVFIFDSGHEHHDVEFTESGVVLHRFRSTEKMQLLFRHISRLWPFTAWTLKLCLGKEYKCFIGVDWNGLAAATFLGMVFRKPWVYFSIELLLSTDPLYMSVNKYIKPFELWCSRRSSLIIIQDRARAQLMADDNKIQLDRFVYLPNSPLGNAQQNKTDFLRRQFGFENRAKLLLYSGSISDTFWISEMTQSALSFPDDWKLVIQPRQNYSNDEQRRKIHQCENVFISRIVVPYSQLKSLVSSADIGIALYDVRLSPNIVYTGKSSGKLCQYLYCGLPVITTRMPYWEEALQFYHSGISVDSPNDIKNAAEQIFSDYDRFSEGALHHFERDLRFEPAFEVVVSRIGSLNGKTKLA